MLKNFFRKRRAIKAIKEWKKSPVGQALANHTDAFLYGDTLLSSHNDEYKKKIIYDFYQKVFSVPQAENPFIHLRELIASYVIRYAYFQVICLKETEKKASCYADCPYISAELYKNIKLIAAKHDVLCELKREDNDLTDEDLISICNAKSSLNLYYANGMNLVRADLNDLSPTNPKKDWFRPFTTSMLIWEEDNIRKKIGLPSLLTDSSDAFKYSSFMNLVIKGHEKPYYEWEATWGEWEAGHKKAPDNEPQHSSVA